ncbi:hypothetical protein ACKZDW_04145 (plasmid) [Ralstonia syzygii subsp. celebesensis]|uniref:Uncharacterized protein n=2 Tax=Ralstonia syzygii subsp. celebesensis TaxID=1310168 RepID=A0A1U9VQZ3_9RALS|nr:hypothetical protein [Ralstonia syzygii]AQW32693.1 hypothetical protein B0B51_23210 [blood disease bacterium A2-HR MARDI]QQV57726.1 hypothetical protein JK151_19970 [Ralstonia syzygii subsp. celebesensis]CCA83752.1 conserved hypothetical protein [blood disease bacterium R229]
MAHPNLQNIVNGSKVRAERNALKVCTALMAAAEKGCTTRELAEWTGLSRYTCLLHLYAMQDRDEAHLGKPRASTHRFIDVWVYGPADAKAEAQRADPEEAEMKADIAAAHEQWASKWRPHRPAEAAWI